MQLGIDKSNRLAKTFDTRDDEQVTPLLDAMELVLRALQDGGVEPFLAYGTLLGAVREGGFIGHDSDIDLGYVSRHPHPVDVVRESFRLQRELRREGLRDRPLQRCRLPDRRDRDRRQHAAGSTSSAATSSTTGST